MKKILIAMLDRKTQFCDLQAVDFEEAAKRSFAYAVNQDGIPNFAPADFELYKVGEFDTSNGRINPLDKIELIATGLDVFGR